MNYSAMTLDALMNQLGLSNGDLVKASTEQLTFKMVSKGRAGKPLTPNVQEKIHNALLAAKPGVQIRRRDLFRRPASPELITAIDKARAFIAGGKPTFPQYVDVLGEAGVHAYTVEVGSHRVVFYAAGSEAYEIQGAPVSSSRAGIFNEEAIRAAIRATQKKEIDYFTFLQRIHAAGIENYEVNVRNRKIIYRGWEESYREDIPVSGTAAQPTVMMASIPASKVVATGSSARKKKKQKKKSMTRKARMSANKRYRAKLRARRPARRKSR